MSETNNFSSQLIVTNPNWLIALLGTQDKYVNLIEDNFAVTIANRGEMINLSGENEQEVEQVRQLLLNLLQLMERNITPRTMDVMTAIKMTQNNTLDYFLNLYDEVVGRAADGKAIQIGRAHV